MALQRPLTVTESEIAALRRQGLTQREIAELRGISLRTVQVHCARVSDKGWMPRRRYSYPRYVYFLRAANGLIKIGCAIDYRVRHRMIQQASPIDVQVIGARLVDDGLKSEDQWLRRFSHLKVKGEWHASSPEFEAAIKDYVG